MSKDTIKRVVRTYFVTVLGLWIPGLLGWINAVTEWARGEGSTPFPDAHGLAYLGVAAITAAFPAAINLLLNSIEDGAGKGLLRSVPPSSRADQGGYMTRQSMVLFVAGALVLAVVLILLAQ
jgi:hypothetical protein